MNGKVKPEVLVIGAGPVGLFAALALATRGVRVQIVDKEWRTGAHSYALALHGQSLRLLEAAGLSLDFVKQACRVRRIGLYDGAARRAEIVLARDENSDLPLVVLRQDELERLLETSLKRLGVNVLWNHEVSQLALRGDRVVAAVDKLAKESLGYAATHTEWVVAKSMEVEAPFVVAADGHRSVARRQLNIDFPEVGPPQHFAVFEFKSDGGETDEMRLAMGEHTTDVLWPLSNGYRRWSLQLPDFSLPAGSRAKDRIAVQVGRAQFPVLEEDRLARLLAERSPWFGERVQEIQWRIAVRFECRLAGAFGRGRVWLAGDAGHATGPAGMQSMNVGLREASDLADAIAGILRRGESANRLESYNRERLAEWRFLLAMDGGLQPRAETDPWIVGRRGRLLSCLPASGADLEALARQVGLEAK